MENEINELRKRIEKLEQDNEMKAKAVFLLMNKELALKAAIFALAREFPPGALEENFSACIDRIASKVAPHLQDPDAWNEIQEFLSAAGPTDKSLPM